MAQIAGAEAISEQARGYQTYEPAQGSRLCRLGYGSCVPLDLLLLTIISDHNQLRGLTIIAECPSLRVLRVTSNLLSSLDVTGLKDLRTLYVDHNRLTDIVGFEYLEKLENFSMREQSGSSLSVPCGLSPIRTNLT